MHGYEPALAPALPALYDARKALAWLGAKLAATLLVGEPLSPEERAHAPFLATLAPPPEVSPARLTLTLTLTLTLAVGDYVLTLTLAYA